MAFTVVGILFIMLFGVEIAYQEFFPAQDPELDGHPVRINNSEIIPVVRFPNETQELRAKVVQATKFRFAENHA